MQVNAVYRSVIIFFYFCNIGLFNTNGSYVNEKTKTNFLGFFQLLNYNYRYYLFENLPQNSHFTIFKQYSARTKNIL